MRSKAFALFTAAVMLLNLVTFAAADTNRRKSKKRQGNALVSLLPASDGVATLNSRRLFNDAMPQILAANQPMLASIMTHIAEIESKTGLDLKKFDSVAIGLAVTPKADKKFEFEPVAIARGDLRAGALIAIAKLASNGTYREERFGERTIYVFSAKDIMKKTSAKSGTSSIPSVVNDALDSLTREIAVTALDDNTLVFGSLARVRETLDAKTHVSPEVTSLLAAKENAVLNFAMRTPEGMASMLPVDNDELGANVNSVRFLTGSMDVTPAGTSMQVTARTATAEQAQSFFNTLDGLKMLGKAILGNSKRADQRLYARMIENAKIAVKGNAVSLDLFVSQADTDLLVASVK